MKETRQPIPDYLGEIPPEGVLVSGELSFEKWQATIQLAFQGLEHLSNSPLAKELRAYPEQANEKLQFLQQPVGLSPALARQYLGRVASLGPEELEGRLLATLGRIRRETHYLDDLDASDTWSLLLKEWAGKRLHLPIVVYPHRNPLIPRRLCKEYNAGYFPSFGIIVMCHDLPSAREAWQALVTQGVFPRPLASLHHEITHHLQYSPSQHLINNALLISSGPLIFSYNHNPTIRLATILATSSLTVLSLTFSENDLILGETQAWSATANSPSSLHNSGGEVINTVVTLYPDGPATNLKALRAYRLIQALRLLGVSDRNIGRLVQKAKWSRQAETYPHLQREVEQRFATLGIKGEGEQEIVLAALRVRHALELLVNRHQAQEIASGELQAAARW